MDRSRTIRLGMPLIVAALVAGCASRQATGPTQTGGTDQGLVGVVLREFEFEPRPLKVKAGKVRFFLMNRGSVDHDFMIPDVMSAMEHEQDLVKPGKSRTIEVELKPGTYEVICTVPGHKESGMKVTIEVTT